MLTSMKKMCQEAKENKKIVPAFNVFGYEDAKIIIEVAESLSAPAILMSNKDAVKHMDLEISGPLFRAMADQSSTQVVVHLDHGKDFALCKRAIASGYSSVMYDGSQLAFDENIANTKEIVDYAHPRGISVEAEIGAVGYADPSIDYSPVYTKPNEAKVFAESTGVDALAVAVGTLHRMTTQNAVLQYHLLEEIEELTDVPLVIHGSTGLADKDLILLKESVVGKINIGTALRMTFGRTMKRFMNNNPEEFDRLAVLQAGMVETKQVVMNKYKLLGW